MIPPLGTSLLRRSGPLTSIGPLTQLKWILCYSRAFNCNSTDLELYHAFLIPGRPITFGVYLVVYYPILTCLLVVYPQVLNWSQSHRCDSVALPMGPLILLDELSPHQLSMELLFINNIALHIELLSCMMRDDTSSRNEPSLP